MNAKLVMMVSGCLWIQVLYSADHVSPEQLMAYVGFLEQLQVDQQPSVDQQPTAEITSEQFAQLEARLTQCESQIKRSKSFCDAECQQNAKHCAVGASLPVSIPLACIYGFFCGAFRGCLRNGKMNAEESCGGGCKASVGMYCLCCPYYSCMGLCSGAAEGAYTMPRKPISYACGLKTDTRWQEHCVESLGVERSTREERDSRDCCKLWFCEDSNSNAAR